MLLMAIDRSVAESTFEGETRLVRNMKTIINERKSVIKVDEVNLVIMNSKVFWFEISVNLSSGRMELFHAFNHLLEDSRIDVILFVFFWSFLILLDLFNVFFNWKLEVWNSKIPFTFYRSMSIVFRHSFKTLVFEILKQQRFSK